MSTHGILPIEAIFFSSNLKINIGSGGGCSAKIGCYVPMSKKQVCFVAGGYMFCNYVVRKDGSIQESLSGKWLRFPYSGKLIKNKVLAEAKTLPTP